MAPHYAQPSNRRATLHTLAAPLMLLAILPLAGCPRAAKAPPHTGASLGTATLTLPAREAATVIAWRPDGLAIAAEVSPLVSGTPSVEAGRIVVWTLDEGDHHAWMTEGPRDSDPGWLSDGSRVLFSRPTGHGVWLCAADPATKGTSPVPNSLGLRLGIVGGSSGFQPDAGTVLLTGKSPGGRMGVYAWDHRANAVRPVVVRPDGDALDPVSPPGGAWLGFTLRKGETRRLVVTSPDRRRTLCASPESAGNVVEYALADHGAALVYCSDAPQGGELHRLSIPGGRDTVLARAESFVSGVSVNSRSGHIAVGVQESGSFPQIRIYDAAGQTKASTAPGFTMAAPAWSPDGGHLAFCVSPTAAAQFRIEAVEDGRWDAREWTAP